MKIQEALYGQAGKKEYYVPHCMCLGAAAVVVQAICGREILALVGGMEISLGLFIAGWLLCAGAGTWAGPRLGRIWGAQNILGWGAIAECWMACGSIFLIRFLAGQLLRGDGLIPHPAYSCAAILLAAAPGAFVAGAALGVAVGAKEDQAGGSAPLFWDAVAGAVAGGVYSLFAAGRWSHMEAAFGLGLGGSLYGALWLWRAHPASTRRRWLFFLPVFGACFATFALAGGLAHKWERTTIPFRPPQAQQGTEQLVTVRQSRYQQLILAEFREQFTIYANNEPVLSYPDLEGGATAAHFAATCAPNPGKVFLSGAVGHSTIRPLLLHQPEQVDVMAFDREVLSMIEPYLTQQDATALHDPAVRVLTGDPARHLAGCEGVYDLIWLNLPPPSSLMTNRYYTRRFYNRMRRALSPEGVLIFSTVGAPNYLGKELGAYLGILRATVEDVFSEVVELPGNSEVFVCAKKKGVIPDGPEHMIKRFRARKILAHGFQAEIFYLLWEPDHAAKRQEDLRAFVRQAAPNADMTPAAIHAYLRLWGKFQEGGWGGLERLLDLSVNWFWGMAILVCGLALACAIKQPEARGILPQRAGFWLASAYGASGILAEIMVLGLFQSACGYVYEQMALLFGVYVLGFGAGCALTHKALARAWCPCVLVGYSFLGLCANLGVIWLITGPGWENLSDVFVMRISPILLAAPAVCAGAGMPALIAWLSRSGKAVSGNILCADYMAAAFGALATSVIFIPWVGMSQTAGAGCLFSLTALVIWARYRAPVRDCASLNKPISGLFIV